MLKMLKAYDEEQHLNFLEAAKQMFTWLETVREYLGEEIMLLNSLQIIRRERALNFCEKQRLYSIVSSSEEVCFRLGAFILLDEYIEAQKLLNELPQKDKDEFMSFPIYSFYRKFQEKADNGPTKNAQP